MLIIFMKLTVYLVYARVIKLLNGNGDALSRLSVMAITHVGPSVIQRINVSYNIMDILECSPLWSNTALNNSLPRVSFK